MGAQAKISGVCFGAAVANRWSATTWSVRSERLAAAALEGNHTGNPRKDTNVKKEKKNLAKLNGFNEKERSLDTSLVIWWV